MCLLCLKVCCVALFSVWEIRKGWREEFFAVLEEWSVKRVGDKIFESGGETKSGWKQEFLENLEGEPT